MKKVIDWVKKNKVLVILLVIIAYLGYRGGFLRLGTSKTGYTSRSVYEKEAVGEVALDMAAPRSGMALPPVGGRAAPQPEVKDRLVVEESSISLLVENVRQKVDQVISYAEEKGGYMVSSKLTQPEEAPYATVVLRIPQKDLRVALEHFRGLAIRVTSENLKGRDVTDEYVDIEARIETLEKTKAKFEDIMTKAVKVDEILRVQRELIYLQDQIDNLIGRQEYLKKTAENAKITIHLSSDEWALPYAPSKPFRPKVIFKQAVRSLVLTLRGLAKILIWIGVYAVIWLPALVIFHLIKKRKKHH